jgi:hypothetical protein
MTRKRKIGTGLGAAGSGLGAAGSGLGVAGSGKKSRKKALQFAINQILSAARRKSRRKIVQRGGRFAVRGRGVNIGIKTGRGTFFMGNISNSRSGQTKKVRTVLRKPGGGLRRAGEGQLTNEQKNFFRAIL